MTSPSLNRDRGTPPPRSDSNSSWRRSLGPVRETLRVRDTRVPKSLLTFNPFCLTIVNRQLNSNC